MKKRKTLELKAKQGHWANVGRQEVILHLDPEELPEVYQLLRAFGIDKGCSHFYHRVDYRLGNISLSLKDSGLAPDHWEAEISAEKKDEKRAHQKLQKFIEKLNLFPWGEKEYMEIIEKIYRENLPIEFEKIDVSRIFIK